MVPGLKEAKIVIVPIETVHIGIGALLIALSIPLALRKVPRNHVYGVRIGRAFESDENWYAINAYGGKVLIALGTVLLAFGLAGGAFAPPPTSAWAPVYLSVPILLLVPALITIAAYARRLPRRDHPHR